MVKETILVPNLKETLKPRWAHKPGFWMSEEYELIKHKTFEQSTTPEDEKLLSKIGLKKKEKVLAVAGYYGSWASQIALAGARVDYSDISKEIVDYSRKTWGKLFGEYIKSNYELIPSKKKEYDWTFTYEACGGNSGLPLAYLRSLLNKKGGIMVLHLNKKHPHKMGSKPKNYPLIVKTLGGIYNVTSKIKRIMIEGHKKNKKNKRLAFMVYAIHTNNAARDKVYFDLKVLDMIDKKKTVHLDTDAKKLKVSSKRLEESVKRLNGLARIMGREFVKRIEVRGLYS